MAVWTALGGWIAAMCAAAAVLCVLAYRRMAYRQFGGVTGVWSLFSGFRTVQDYRAARARSEAEFKLREDRMLAVVTSVADAWRNWKETRDRVRAAVKLREAAALDYVDAERRYDDGQETLNRVLDKLTDKDAAEVRAISAEYAAALAEITLRQALGMKLYE